MDGQFQNNKSIDKWALPIINNKVSWEANNLHIDEIEELKDISREHWLQTSILLLIMTYRNYLDSNYVLFLHIPLKPSHDTTNVQSITKRWIERNLSNYSPPSLNFTTKEYFKEFYKKELIRIKSVSNLNGFDNPEELLYFYRIFFPMKTSITTKYMSFQIYRFFPPNLFFR